MKVRLIGGMCVFFMALVAGVSANAGDFKGFYLGGYSGGGHGSSDAQTSTIFSPTGYFATTSPPAIATAGAQNLGANGFSGGGQAGYNFQHMHFVFGFETDFGAMKTNDSQSTTAIYPCCVTTNFTVTQSFKTDWLFTMRPRIGFTAGPVLFYGTGGLAVSNLNYQALFTDTFATAHENGGVDQTQTGWTAGGGAEFQFGSGKHWSLKGEYLYANLGTVSVTSTNLTAPSTTSWPTNIFTHSTDLRAHLGRFGFNYRF